MNCQQVQKRLSAFHDGELPAAMMTAIARHLKTCERCSQSLAELRAVWNILGQVDRIDRAPFFWTRLSQRLSASADGRARRKRSILPVAWRPQLIMVSMLLVVGLFLGFYVGKSLYHHTAAGQTTPVEQTLEHVYSLNAFDDFPKESIADIYVTLISDDNQK